MNKACALALALGAAVGVACSPRPLPALYPSTERERVARELLEFHEDRFLADHNQELAEAWQDYRRARERLVQLWQEHASVVDVDPESRRRSEEDLLVAKRDFVKSAERLRRLSQNMAEEAARIVRAALRVPPVHEPNPQRQ